MFLLNILSIQVTKLKMVSDKEIKIMEAKIARSRRYRLLKNKRQRGSQTTTSTNQLMSSISDKEIKIYIAKIARSRRFQLLKIKRQRGPQSTTIIQLMSSTKNATI